MSAVKPETAVESSKPRRLGRGLSSLLNIGVPVEVSVPQTPAATQVAPTAVKSETSLSDLTRIPVAKVHPSPFQPRQSMDDAALGRLAESIRRSGMLQPILVRPGVNGTYELVAGERRWRAATLAGIVEIPAIVRPLSDEDAAEHALVENVQREDLNPMDRAWALRKLSERFGLTQTQLAERVGLERSSVANLIRLTDLEPEIAGLIAQQRLTAGHGKALLGVSAGASRVALAKKAADFEMSVRGLENLIQTGDAASTGAGVFKGKEAPSAKDEARLAVLADLQKQIGQQLGTKVSIVTDRRGKRGRVIMEFYGLDHFDSLMSRLGVKTH